MTLLSSDNIVRKEEVKKLVFFVALPMTKFRALTMMNWVKNRRVFTICLEAMAKLRKKEAGAVLLVFTTSCWWLRERVDFPDLLPHCQYQDCNTLTTFKTNCKTICKTNRKIPHCQECKTTNHWRDSVKWKSTDTSDILTQFILGLKNKTKQQPTREIIVVPAPLGAIDPRIVRATTE